LPDGDGVGALGEGEGEANVAVAVVFDEKLGVGDSVGEGDIASSLARGISALT
jgi:hypothetical protein